MHPAEIFLNKIIIAAARDPQEALIVLILPNRNDEASAERELFKQDLANPWGHG